MHAVLFGSGMSDKKLIVDKRSPYFRINVQEWFLLNLIENCFMCYDLTLLLRLVYKTNK